MGKRTSDQIRNANYKQRYGLTTIQVEEMNDQQGGACAICKVRPPYRLRVDHVGEVVRGLLCQNCNTALGKFMEQPELLLKAIAYVMRAREA